MTFEKLLQQSLVWRGLYFFSLLLVNIFLSRSLQADGTGWIYYLTNFFSFILLVASLSMESGYTYYAAGNIISHHKLAWFSLCWTLLICIISAAGVGIYFKSIKGIDTFYTDNFIYYAATYISGILLINFFMVLFYAQKNYATPNILLSVINFLLIIIILLNPKSYNIVVNSYFYSILTQGILLAIAFIYLNKSFQLISLPDKSSLKLLLNYSLVALTSNVIFFFVYRIDYWFVKYNVESCTPADLGNYIQASKLGQMMLIVPQIFASVIFPHTASGASKNNITESIHIFFRIFLQVLIVALIVVSIIGNWLFPAVFGITFNKMTMPVLLLLPGIFSLSVLCLLSAYFGGVGKVKINVIGGVYALIIVIIGNLIFIPLYGIIGAAIVSSIGYSVNLVYSFYHFFKDNPTSIKTLFIFKRSDWVWVKKMLFHKSTT
ncbi:MAG TPA: polysaccharide biosynthesis C-terminal domain-containing protein [Chitinophagaceae bacterium]|nr:polysaccharide biosynthesis C-terminal domain-containing protein [Chitinophagaceae bacterium]HNE94148.1 polysaccharide biosynthesis C-terminal domain-containing protein [Chitinophagaceae bacterium]HNM33832.1 polysaccharide biosynthesis C-terminal domain-containing protein [Chitinophagaceae bacterium]